MRTTEISASICPFCSHEFDAVTSLGSNRVPKPGSVAICIGCGQWMVFADDLSLRAPSPQEMAKIEASPTAKEIREAWREMHGPRH